MFTLDKLPKAPVKFSNPLTIPSIFQLSSEVFDTIDYDVYLPSKGFNLQRGFVWTLSQKRAFIISILQGKRIAPLSINESIDNNVLQIIDGKQRLSTVIDFFRNKFSIVVGGEEFFFKDFSTNASYYISLFSFDAFIHFERSRDEDSILTDDQKIQWFLYVNDTATAQQDSYLEELRGLV